MRRAGVRDVLTLDHLFVIARPGRDEELAFGSLRTADRWARSLIDAGFTEGTGQRHPGQGTANRRFFFERFMLELLYVDDEQALDDDRGQVLALRERFTNALASPFGIGCRPATTGNGDASFAAIAYRPSYLPDTLRIDVACEIGAEDPLLFHLTFLSPFDQLPPDAEPREHANGAVRLESIELQSAGAIAARLLSVAGVATVDAGCRHRLSLVFGAAQADALSTVRLTVSDDLPLTISIRR